MRFIESADPAALIARITAAFADNPRLPHGNVGVPRDRETESLLRNLARLKDAPNDAFVEWHADSLPVFTPEGFRHVLPYYMRYSLLHPDSTPTEFLIFHLSPENADDPYRRDRLAVFSSAQKEAICDFVRHLRMQLVGGQDYDAYFARALTVWGCL